MLIPTLLCDRCQSTRHSPAGIGDERALMRDAVEHGWHVQNVVTDRTYGRAVCPPCRKIDDRKGWA